MGKKRPQQIRDTNILDDSVEQSKDLGKKGKKAKRKNEDFEDDLAEDLAALSVECGVELPETQVKEPQVQVEDVEEKKVDVEKGKGKKSKKNKRKDEDDDELDDMLAELEAEYKGEKPKKVDAQHQKEEKTNGVVDTQELVSDEMKQVESSNNETKQDESSNNETKQAESSNNETKQAESSNNETKQDESSNNETKQDESSNNETKQDESSNNETKQDESSNNETKQDESSNNETNQAAEDGKKSNGDGKNKKNRESETKSKKQDQKEETKTKKGPGKKMLEAMKEMLAARKAAEEKQKVEEEARQRAEDERIRILEEKQRIDAERKAKLKQKQKDKIKRLKEEGKLFTTKQKQDQQRARDMLEQLKAQGVDIPEVGERRPGYNPPKKSMKKRQERRPKEESPKTEVEQPAVVNGEEEKQPEEHLEESDDVCDAWDATDSEEESGSTEASQVKSSSDGRSKESSPIQNDVQGGAECELHRRTELEKRKDRAKSRMMHRQMEYESGKSVENLRSPVVCVLGHVDHGKTKILDKLRKTNVQEGEVGGITQQIGATNVPADAIRSQTRIIKDFDMNMLKFPGLLIIDTPGHESFSNLRNRGSSLCDIAILVIDITQGIEPQTIESINLLKTRKTPFLVALNKVDRVFEWESNPSKDFRELIKTQSQSTKNDFERRSEEIIQSLRNQGLNAALFWENPDPRTYVSLVPTSAISGDGMGNLIALVCQLCQKRLEKRLLFTEELQCTVLEVKAIQGHGITIDVILVNGRLREGNTIILAGTEGPIVTQIRSLLLPKPLKEIRVKGQYDEHKEITAAQGIKLAAKDLEKAIAGLSLFVAQHDDEIEFMKEKVDKEFKTAMRSIKVKDKGVYVQASTLGALEALLEFFKKNKVPYSGIRVGPVVKRDVMKSAAMLEHDPMYAVILAFDVKVEKDAQELADKEGVKIFSEETIYHLGDRYVDYIKDYKKKKQDEFRNVAVFPCKLKVIPNAVFNKRSPIVMGVTVESGLLRTGTMLCVPSKEFVELGIVSSLEFDHKNVEIAKKGIDVCIKIEPLPGHAPRLFGRHFEESDIIVSKISRESIDACKEYFRDDLSKTDWKLMAELKKQFRIL